uniref:Uncharacterized protein n=1 Tax=Schistosoma curassoni TaxID=6186 RepID=A0A183KKT0_9TREM
MLSPHHVLPNNQTDYGLISVVYSLILWHKHVVYACVWLIQLGRILLARSL